MQIIVPHKIYYTANSIQLPDVIESLKAQQRLLEEGIAVLARAAPDSDLRLVAIHVNQIATGSLLIDLGLELYHAYQTSIDDKIIKGIEGLSGVDVAPEYEALVTVAALGVTFFVARWAYDAVFNRKKKDNPLLPHTPPVHIEGNYNTVINIIADRLHLEREAVERAFADELPLAKRSQLVARVTDFLRPAKNEPGSAIEVSGLGAIDAQTISEYPNEAELAGLEETTTLLYPRTKIEIRATDRDSLKSGWKAKIVGDKNFPHKLPMELDPGVNADQLADFKIVMADLSIEFIRDSSNSLRAKRLHLKKFYTE